MKLPPDVDLDWIFGFLRPRAVPAIERVTEDGYERVVRLPSHGAVRLSIRRTPTGIAISSEPPLDERELGQIVTQAFDLTTDADAFRAHAADDPLLGAVVRARPSVRLPQLVDPFEALMRAMLGQQVSVRAASTLADRMARRLGERVSEDDDDRPAYAFPDASTVAATPVDTLRAFGMPGKRAASMQRAAAAIDGGAIHWETLRRAPAEEAQRALDALPGVGPWTASYVRMRSLGDRDAFPAADLGVVKALARHGVDAKDAERHAERWRPWRAYATLYLWESLGGP